ncbi:LuxR C-terminal-related transcriptional regulator [Wenyingzhuangia sp. 1_MG-2023]|nr:LuxR C-terminal-related transcriptional regulator [Wenyingzhuangia sp. 1_MG-2023]
MTFVSFKNVKKTSKNKEIADELGISIKTVEAHVTSSSKFLKEKIEVFKDIAVLEHIAWFDGELISNKAPFEEILKRLERSLDVTIVNHNKILSNQYFSGAIKVEKSNLKNL